MMRIKNTCRKAAKQLLDSYLSGMVILCQDVEEAAELLGLRAGVTNIPLVSNRGETVQKPIVYKK